MPNKRKTVRKQLYWLGILLAGLILFSGCSQAEGQKQPKQENSSQGAAGNQENNGRESSIQPERDEGQQRTEETANTEEVIWTPAPVISPTYWQDNRYTEDGGLLVEGTFQAFEVSGEGYEIVAEAIRGWFLGEEEAFVQSMNQKEEYAEEVLEDTPSFYPYYQNTKYNSTRADSSIISISCLYDEYFGGAHGLYGTWGTTFDVQTGERLSFWDLTGNREEFAKKTLEYCLELAKKEHEDMLFESYEATIRGVWETEPNWYLDGAGITIVFTPYEIGPFAMGEAHLTLPYQEFADLLLPEYQMGSQAGVAVLPEGVGAQINLGQVYSGKESVKLFARPVDGENYGLRTYVLELGEKTEIVAQMDRLVRSYLLQREDGRSFLLFYGDMASEDYVTYVYELTDGNIRKVQDGETGAFIQSGSVNAQGFTLGIRVDALGTYTAYGDYILTEDGLVEPAGEWCTISQGSILTTVRELPVMVDGRETVLPVGSRIQLIGTDRKGVLRYQMVNSVEEGEIHFTLGEGGWPVYIDGIEETAYFEDLPYAG